MAIDKEQVAHVARLARLSFDEAELDRFTEQLSQIIEYADRVSSVATEDVPPTAHPLPVKNVFRPDEIGECLPQDKALSTAPERDQDRFKVPRILEEPQ